MFSAYLKPLVESYPHWRLPTFDFASLVFSHLLFLLPFQFGCLSIRLKLQSILLGNPWDRILLFCRLPASRASQKYLRNQV